METSSLVLTGPLSLTQSYSNQTGLLGSMFMPKYFYFKVLAHAETLSITHFPNLSAIHISGVTPQF